MSTGVAASCRTNATAGQCQTRRRSPMIIRCETTRKNTAGPYERGVCGPPQSGGECTSCGRPDDRAHADRSCCAGIGHRPFRALAFRGPPGRCAAPVPASLQASSAQRVEHRGMPPAEQRTSVQYFRLWPEWFCASGSRVRDVVSHLRRDAGPGFESNGVNSYIGEGNFACWVVALGSSGHSSTPTPRDAWAHAPIAQRPPATCSVWPET